jgi:hypothetical protein
MYDFLFGGSAAWFTVPAIVGTGVFLIRLVMMGAGDHAMDIDHGDAHADPGEGFKILSIQTIAAFLMGFGWIALVSYRSSSIGTTQSALIGAGGGIVSVYVLGLLLKGLYNLQSSGTMTLASTVGHHGEVYVTVPGRGQGTGQVRVVVDNRQRIVNAVSATDEPLPTSTRVRVVKANDDNTVTVAAA